MKPVKFIPAILAIIVFLFIMKSFFDQYVPSYDFPGWKHGASGFRLALQEAKSAEKSLIIYFHTSWCRWCEKLNNNYLATHEVEEFLRNITKVEINPDKGKPEKLIFKEFGLSGYPSFLVFNPKQPRDPVRISPFLQNRTLTVKEFIDEIRKWISR